MRRAHSWLLPFVVTAMSLMLVACGAAGSGGGAAGLSQLRKKGVVRIGVSNALPAGGMVAGKGAGVFPEEAALIMRKLGVPKAQFVLLDFGAIIPSLQSGRIDVAAPGLYITAARCRAVRFSNPALGYLESLAVKRGNPKGISTYKDVARKGLQLGVVTGSFETGVAKAAGVPAANTQEYPDVPSMLAALQVGRIDAAGYDNVTIAYYMAKSRYSDLQSTTPYAPGGPGSVGLASVAFGKNSGDLQNAYNAEQSKLAASGGLKPILEQWATPPQSVNLASNKQASSLCKAQ